MALSTFVPVPVTPSQELLPTENGGEISTSISAISGDDTTTNASPADAAVENSGMAALPELPLMGDAINAAGMSPSPTPVVANTSTSWEETQSQPNMAATALSGTTGVPQSSFNAQDPTAMDDGSGSNLTGEFETISDSSGSADAAGGREAEVPPLSGMDSPTDGTPSSASLDAIRTSADAVNSDAPAKSAPLADVSGSRLAATAAAATTASTPPVPAPLPTSAPTPDPNSARQSFAVSSVQNALVADAAPTPASAPSPQATEISKRSATAQSPAKALIGSDKQKASEAAKPIARIPVSEQNEATNLVSTLHPTSPVPSGSKHPLSPDGNPGSFSAHFVPPSTEDNPFHVVAPSNTFPLSAAGSSSSDPTGPASVTGAAIGDSQANNSKETAAQSERNKNADPPTNLAIDPNVRAQSSTIATATVDPTTQNPLNHDAATAGASAKGDSSASTTQTSAPSSSRPDLPASAPTGSVQLAHMINKAAQTEMRIGFNTTAFGNVEVRTVVHANDVGVQIGSERGDLRSLLANDLPAITNHLQQQNLRLSEVNFHQAGFGSSGNSASGGDSRQRSFTPQPAAISQQFSDGLRADATPTPETRTVARGTGLSILA